MQIIIFQIESPFNALEKFTSEKKKKQKSKNFKKVKNWLSFNYL